MSKKISTIFLSLFLIGILSVSCSNKDKTGAGDGNSAVDNSKGIEQYAATYKSDSQYDTSSGKISIYIRVNADGSIDMGMDENFTIGGNMPASTISGSGNNYNIDSGDGNMVGTLKIDSNKATLNFTKQVGFERDEKLKLLIGQDISMTKI